jgi:hypothetical protein
LTQIYLIALEVRMSVQSIKFFPRYSVPLRVVVASALLFTVKLLPAADITDADWRAVNPYGILATDGEIRDMTYNNGKLYVIGTFNHAGTSVAKNIAAWDGKSWSGFGNGVNEYPTAIQVDGKGNIYILADPDTMGKKLDYQVSNWDGTGWHRLGNDEWDIVGDFVLDSTGKPYVAGEIIRKNNKDFFAIFRWNGVSWDSIPTVEDCSKMRMICLDSLVRYTTCGGMGFEIYNGKTREKHLDGLLSGNSVRMGRDEAGNIYACVERSEYIATVTYRYFQIIRWTGTEWKKISESTSGVVNDFLVGGDGTLYVCGSFRMIDSVVCNNIAMWDGTQWVGLGNDRGVDKDYDEDKKYFGDYDEIKYLAYDGNGTLYAEGRMRIVAGSDLVTGIFRWNKGKWKPLGPGINGDVYAIAFNSRGTMFLGGDFSTFDTMFVNNIMQRDSRGWNGLGTGVNNVYSIHFPAVNDIVFNDNGDLIAAGAFTIAGGQPIRSIAKWNGSEWGNLGDGLIEEEGITSICKDNRGNLYAASRKHYQDWNGSISYWNGTQWEKNIFKIPLKSGQFSKIAFKNDVLYAIGSFHQIDKDTVSLFARWNGTFWDSVPGPVCKTGWYFFPDAFAWDAKERMYVAGSLDQDAARTSCLVYRLDGNNWTRLGNVGFLQTGGDCGGINSLAFDSKGNLYAGGNFDSADGSPAKNIAKWDGTRWSNLGSGTDSSVLTLNIVDTTMYVGGCFRRAGGIFSSRIACVNLNGSGSRISKPGCRAGSRIVPFDFKVVRSMLVVSGAADQDMVTLFSISGRRIYSGSADASILLKRFARQPLILNIIHKGKPVLSRMLMVQ